MLYYSLACVIVVQGTHVFEHIVQLLQVYAFQIPEDDALGLLGYVLDFQGTEEWLHLGYNTLYVSALYALVFPLWLQTPRILSRAVFVAFLSACVLETWHVVEHLVIISHVLKNNGCPCPGIVDSATGVSDTVLHFFYNVFAYIGVVLAFAAVRQARSAISHRP